MASLLKISAKAAPQPPPPPGGGSGEPRRLDLTLNFGRTLALTLVALALLGLAGGLFFADKNAPAMGFFALGEAVLVSGFGIVIGSREGAQEAEKTLQQP